MHALQASGNIPAFLSKLWKVVSDPCTNQLIRWNGDGESFTIYNQANFARKLLPQYYKHSNMASFIRQLNMYGFHKVVSAESGGLKLDKDEIEFRHPNFIKAAPELLADIKRKIPSTKGLSKVLDDIKTLKSEQDMMKTKFHSIKRENEALWRESMTLRQRFTKQQQIIEKLINFLMAFVKTKGNSLGQKRKYHCLALEGKSSDDPVTQGIYIPKFEHKAKVELAEINEGPVIHEVTDLMESEIEDAENQLLTEPSLPEASEVGGTFGLSFVDTAHPGKNKKIKREYETDSTLAQPSFSVPEYSFINLIDGDLSLIPEENQENIICDEDPLSSDILETVDPSVVTPVITVASGASSNSNALLVTIPQSQVDQTKFSQPLASSPNGYNKKSIGKLGYLSDPYMTSSNFENFESALSLAVPKSEKKQDIKKHVDDVQNTLESLHEMLLQGQFSIDPSTLLSLFSTDDLDPLITSQNETNDSAVVSLYNPTGQDDYSDEATSMLQTPDMTPISTPFFEEFEACNEKTFILPSIPSASKGKKKLNLFKN